MMKIRFIAVILAAVLATAGVMAFNNHSPSTSPEVSTLPSTNTAASTGSETDTSAYLDQFKAGYSDGFGAGVGRFNYPDQSEMASNARGYLDGFSQGYSDGQEQQAALRSEICPNARVSSAVSALPRQDSTLARQERTSYSNPNTATNRSANSYYNSSVERRPVDRGIGSTARKAMLIGGGTAAGAGIGGAIGGKKGALIGALAGGGAGTALAYSKKPSGAFDRRVSKKTAIRNTLLGAGAGAGVGALAGGKRGALAGAAIGGAGGAVWSLMTGQRSRR